jgi:hypothetical protein
MKGNGTSDTQKLTVARNSRTTVTVKDKMGVGDDAARDFSARVECTNDQQILVERPVYFNYKDAWTGGARRRGVRFPAVGAFICEGRLGRQENGYPGRSSNEGDD